MSLDSGSFRERNAGNDRVMTEKSPTTISVSGQAPSLYFAIAAAVIVAVYLVLTIVNSFLCDDAYITFRYAKHLAAGMGPVFNAGERVEGYSSFLWMILMAMVIKLGGRPEFWSLFCSQVCGVGIIILIIAWIRSQIGTAIKALTIPALIAICAPFVTWSSGGMETTLAAFLILISTLLLLRFQESGRFRELAGSSIAISLAMLTRPESLIVAAVATVFLLAAAVKRTIKSYAVAVYVLPAVVLVGAHLFWRWSFYGRLLPNPYYVKTPGFDLIGFGFRYVGRFWLESVLWLPVGAVLLYAWRAKNHPHPAWVRFLPITILLFFIGVVYSGGDFMMMSRYLVPVIPLILLWLTYAIRTCWQQMHGRWWNIGLTGFLILYASGNIYFMYDARRIYNNGTLDSIGILEGSHLNWQKAALLIKSISRPTDTIATSAAGIIPYYTDLPTVDILGLNAPDLSKFRQRQTTRRPGHSLSIDPDYFMRLMPQFLIGHPRMAKGDDVNFPLGTLADAKLAILMNYEPVSMPIPGEKDLFLYFFMRRDIISRYSGRINIYKLDSRSNN
jgi:arabinofuranosyltransferase